MRDMKVVGQAHCSKCGLTYSVSSNSRHVCMAKSPSKGEVMSDIDKTIERVTRNRSPIYLNCKDFRNDIEAIISDRERLKAELETIEAELKEKRIVVISSRNAYRDLKAELSKAQEKIKKYQSYVEGADR